MTVERPGAPVFPTERMYWVGVDVVPPGRDGPEEADRVFEEICAVEGLDPSGLTRMTLSRPDPRGDIGARYVASFSLSSDVDLVEFAERQARRAQGWAAVPSVRPRWRVVFERFLEVGAPEPQAPEVTLVAMTPALDATAEQLDDFNEFYDETHLAEVLHDWNWRRVSRYELRHELLHPAPGCPRYLAVYEVGEGSRPVPLSEQGEHSYSDGPSAWRGRNTAWRLRYDVSP